ncbi:hypothetical protein BDF19DRAFT_449610 [Syncephalis fuscata]|nr:hypothetical protein BDF19DRAFT_449610 [Syncephalis fuscata]
MTAAETAPFDSSPVTAKRHRQQLSVVSNRPKFYIPPFSRLFIGNIVPNLVQETDLREIFEIYGKVLEISIKGTFAFVQFDNAESCATALANQRSQPIKGHFVDIEMCRKQPRGYYAALARQRQQHDHQQHLVTESSDGPVSHPVGTTSRHHLPSNGSRKRGHGRRNHLSYHPYRPSPSASSSSGSNNESNWSPGPYPTSPPSSSSSSSNYQLSLSSSSTAIGPDATIDSRLPNQSLAPSAVTPLPVDDTGYHGYQHRQSYHGHHQRYRQSCSPPGRHPSTISTVSDPYYRQSRSPSVQDYNDHWHSLSLQHLSSGEKRPPPLSLLAPVTASVSAPTPIGYYGSEVPLCQIIVLDPIQPRFISFIEQGLKVSPITVKTVYFSPDRSLRTMVRQMVTEGTRAVVFLENKHERLSRLSMQLFHSSLNPTTPARANIRSDEYEDITIDEAIAIIERDLNMSLTAACIPTVDPHINGGNLNTLAGLLNSLQSPTSSTAPTMPNNNYTNSNTTANTTATTHVEVGQILQILNSDSINATNNSIYSFHS